MRGGRREVKAVRAWRWTSKSQGMSVYDRRYAVRHGEALRR